MLEIIYKKLDELKPYENNPRINDNAVLPVAESIRKYGFNVPMVIDNDNVIVCGHTRYKAAEELGLDEVPCVTVGDLTDEQIREFRIIDNRTSEFAEWDTVKLAEELNELSRLGSDSVAGMFEDFNITVEEDEERYTSKIEGLIYEPSGDCPKVSELYVSEKFEKLVAEVERLDCEEEMKKFLKLAASRHIEFDYAKIADFYAHADEEVKEAMEASALVIIDYDRAIEEGYVELSKFLEDMRDE